MNPNSNDPLAFVFKLLWGFFTLTILIFGLVLVSAPSSTVPGETPTHLIMPLTGSALVVFLLSLFFPKFLFRFSVKRANVRTLSHFFVPWIIRMALLESVSLFGFVLAFVTRDQMMYAPFALTTLVMYGLSFPSEARLKSIFDE